MVSDAIKGPLGQERRAAVFLLEELDSARNLHRGVAILSFCLSAGLGVFAFFLITEPLLWASETKQFAVLIVALSWVLIFPFWALIFLLIMSLLHALGIRDLRAAAHNGLSALNLDRDQLRDLQETLASRPWRHRELFTAVLADLAGSGRRPGP